MIFEHKLSNGIRVVAKQMTSYKSLSMGVWVKTGSACETQEENGISHFIEHMLFKGTSKRTANQISYDIDSMGGSINAFTSKECSCFHIKVMSEKFEDAVDVLSDIVFNSNIGENEIQRERAVILEEIKMTNDNPEDCAHEKLSETFFADNPVAKPILGPPENVSSFKRDNFISYMDKFYYPANMVISIAGNFEKESAFEILERYFGGYKKVSPSEQTQDCVLSNEAIRCFATVKKDTQQLHMCLSFPGFTMEEEKRYALSILNNVIGGSMSSVLFQKVREEKGLVYSVYSYMTAYTKAGMFSIYAGTSQDYIREVTQIISRELNLIKEKGISEDQFKKSREQLCGNFILSTESTSTIMNTLGRNMLLRGIVLTEEEVLDAFKKVTIDQVNEIIPYIIDFDRLTRVYVGNVLPDEELKKLI
ncbi:MAG: pitrilysin family protein [Eubacteriales bacterium]